MKMAACGCGAPDHRIGKGPRHRTNRTRQRLVRLVSAAAVAVISSVDGVDGFAGTGYAHKHKRRLPSLVQRSGRIGGGVTGGSSSCLRLSSKEEAASPLFEPSTATTKPDALLKEPSNFISQNRNDGSISLPLKAASAAAFLLLLSSADIPSTMAAAYSSLLVEHPLPTKSLTSGVLCGVSDTIAQFRDTTRKKFNYGRLIRFAGKGCMGGIIWSFWYDNLDRFLNIDNEFNIYKLASGALGTESGILNYQWTRDHLSIVTTFLSIVIEQFFWCPIVFGAFEIPVSTLLNGGSLSTVRKEVDSKLNDLLLSNAKVWTLANVAIYNAPVEWRPAVSNCVDLLWQSIVSDVAADCGKVEDDVCEVPIEAMSTKSKDDSEKDYSFFAEKSRI